MEINCLSITNVILDLLDSEFYLDDTTGGLFAIFHETIRTSQHSYSLKFLLLESLLYIFYARTQSKNSKKLFRPDELALEIRNELRDHKDYQLAITSRLEALGASAAGATVVDAIGNRLRNLV